MQHEYLSEERLVELKKELEELKTIERKKIAEQLEYAKSLGDLSENAEYHEAREAQVTIEDRISYLEDIIKRAIVIQSKGGSIVDVGSTVVIEKDKGEKQTVIIVGSEEVNMELGKISNSSPLGSQLMGKKKGDSATVTTPRGDVTYRILEVK